MDRSFFDFILIIGSYGLVFLAIEAMLRRGYLEGEFTRKATHLIAGVAAAMLPLFLTQIQVVGLALVMVVGMLISKKHNIFRSIHSVARDTHGEIWFPVGIAVAAMIGDFGWQFSYGALVLGISDALASIFGIRYGKSRYYLIDGHWKTLLGSTVFFVCTLVIGLVFLSVFTPLSLAVVCVVATICAALLTITEALARGGIDNALLPILGTLLMQLFA